MPSKHERSTLLCANQSILQKTSNNNKCIWWASANCRHHEWARGKTKMTPTEHTHTHIHELTYYIRSSRNMWWWNWKTIDRSIYWRLSFILYDRGCQLRCLSYKIVYQLVVTDVRRDWSRSTMGKAKHHKRYETIVLRYRLKSKISDLIGFKEK